MSTLKVTNIAGLTGSSTNVMEGLAKAWMGKWDFSTNTAVDSFNISTFTDNGTGDLACTFTNAMNSVGYSGTALDNNFSLIRAIAQTTSAFRTVSYNTSYVGYDVSRLHHAINGDLA